MKKQHPMQPIVMVGDVARFKQNAIIAWLADSGKLNMNEIAIIPFAKEDRNQLAQLLGYSVSGYGDLHYADPKIVAKADAKVEKMLNKKPAKPVTE